VTGGEELNLRGEGGDRDTEEPSKKKLGLSRPRFGGGEDMWTYILLEKSTASINQKAFSNVANRRSQTLLRKKTNLSKRGGGNPHDTAMGVVFLPVRIAGEFFFVRGVATRTVVVVKTG